MIVFSIALVVATGCYIWFEWQIAIREHKERK